MNTTARDLTASQPWVSIDDGDALALPYPDDTFDAAAPAQVYEYVADVSATFGRVTPRAADGWTCQFWTPAGTPW